MTVADVDLFEINEAFCSVVLSTIDLLGADPDRFNVQGGAVAFGHPDRRLGRAPGRHAGAPAAATRRRDRAGGDLLRRGPGRRDADRGAGGMSEIRRITVVGAGQMGSGIAQVAAVGGFDVTLQRRGAAPAGAGRVRHRGVAGKAGREGPPGRRRRARPRCARIRTAAEPADADLLIEAATENVELKLRIFGAAGRGAPGDGAILASNTSSIPITRLAAATTAPGAVVGMHFMNPVPLMQLVEVIRGLATSDETLRSACAPPPRRWARRWSRRNDFPGFVSNRILMPMINEAVYCLMEGVGDARGDRHGHEARHEPPDGPAHAGRPDRPRHLPGDHGGAARRASATTSTGPARCCAATSRPAGSAASPAAASTNIRAHYGPRAI